MISAFDCRRKRRDADSISDAAAPRDRGSLRGPDARPRPPVASIGCSLSLGPISFVLAQRRFAARLTSIAAAGDALGLTDMSSCRRISAGLPAYALRWPRGAGGLHFPFMPLLAIDA